jgi:hypothetical protein
MFKALKNGYEILPNTYNFFASKSKLSEKRKTEIEERRGRLKIEEDDPKSLRIVIEEMLAYKPGLVTLDDRYLQLEQVLDAIDKAKVTKQTPRLISLCQEIASELSASPGIFKNTFLERLQEINLRIKAIPTVHLQAKL